MPQNQQSTTQAALDSIYNIDIDDFAGAIDIIGIVDIIDILYIIYN